MIQFSAKSVLSLSLMLFLLTLASAELDRFANPTNMFVWSCNFNDNVNMSALEGNSKVVLNSLVENVNKTGFYTSSHGQKGDTVYGLAQCRGDLNASTCRACVSAATIHSPDSCPYNPYVNISTWSISLSGCFLTYSTQNFYTSYDADESVPVTCDNVTQYSRVGNGGNLDWTISPVVRRVMASAVSSNVSYSTLSDNGVYSLAQCWRDLTMNQCNQCLNSSYNYLGYCPTGTVQGAGLSQGCMILFSTNEKFYGDGIPLLSPTAGTAPSLQPSTAPSLQPFKGAGKNSPHLSLMLKLSVAGIVIVVVLLLTGLVIIWKEKYKKQLVLDDRNPHELLTAMSKSKLHYRYQALQTATNNFNPVNKIGQGGFGSVYKGILPNGTEIAVKRLLANREQSVSDFFNEVNLISNVQHKNLVKLLGFSVAGTERLLVYEYLPNKSLDHFLFDENLGRLLDWQRRFEIILGTAGGLTYLHQESDTRIIHRDIKASNILLDQHFKAKIADFGLVRYFAEDQTHLSTTIVGTRGYMAPEYLVHGHLTEKVDVYAFGVLVLEIISGRKNKTPMHVNDTPSLLKEVWNNYLSGTLSNVIDPNIQENYEELQQVVHVALLCTQVFARLRPSMSKVIVFLTTKNPSLPAPTQPPFIDVDSSQSNTNTSVVPEPETYNSVSNVALPPATPISLNTISTSSFGPR